MEEKERNRIDTIIEKIINLSGDIARCAMTSKSKDLNLALRSLGLTYSFIEHYYDIGTPDEELAKYHIKDDLKDLLFAIDDKDGFSERDRKNADKRKKEGIEEPSGKPLKEFLKLFCHE